MHTYDKLKIVCICNKQAEVVWLFKLVTLHIRNHLGMYEDWPVDSYAKILF